MKVILEAVAGPAIGRRIEILTGTILRIGRTDKSDVPLPEDGYLSSVHFAVGCDGQRCIVRDMGSSNGTFVNGSRIEETHVSASDHITAGGSTFTIQFETAAAAAEPKEQLGRTITTRVFQVPQGLSASPFAQPPAELQTPASRERWAGFSKPQVALLTALYRDDEPLYALVDPLSDNRVPAFLSASGEQYCPLLEGQSQGDASQAVSPSLVLLPSTSRLLDVLIKDGWGKGWAVYLSSRAHPEQVRNHLREYVSLRTETGKTLSCFFHDPRVLRVVAERWAPRECTDFFGPITRFIAEAEDPSIAFELKDTGRGAAKHTIRLGR